MKNEEQQPNHPSTTPGNASNPPAAGEQQAGNQLLDKNAEKYLREGGNIEDLPDDEEQQEAENIQQG